MAAEAKLQAKILKALAMKGCYARKILVANKAGTADILACCQGKFYSIEVKAPKGVVSALQKEDHQQVQAAGGYVIVARTLKDVLDVLPSDIS